MVNGDLLTLTQWLSPAYPVGAFSYSHGLETAIADGHVVSASTLFEWLSDLLRLGSGRTDAILLAATYHAPSDSLQDISELAVALSPSAERRAETLQQGAAFVRTTNAVWALDLTPAPYPVAVGAAASAKAIALEATLQIYLHAFASNLVSAAIRLVPLGQTEGQAVLQALSNSCAEIAQDAASADLDDLGSASFIWDISSMRHEAQNVRLFQS